jgi:hypothetical protein
MSRQIPSWSSQYVWRRVRARYAIMTDRRLRAACRAREGGAQAASLRERRRPHGKRIELRIQVAQRREGRVRDRAGGAAASARNAPCIAHGHHPEGGLFMSGRTRRLLSLAVLTFLGCARPHAFETQDAEVQAMDSPAEPNPGLLGMNINPRFASSEGHTAWASPAQVAMVGVNRVRFEFDVDSRAADPMGEAIAFYTGVIADYTSNGVDVLLILDGKTVLPDPSSSSPDLPAGYADTFAAAAGRIAQAFAGQVHGYEIWNEEDDGWKADGSGFASTHAASAISPDQYGPLFAAAFAAIAQADPAAFVALGGLDSPGSADYVNHLGVSLDPSVIVAMHPYVHWPATDPADRPAGFGTYEDALASFQNATGLGNTVWFTEWGVDREGLNATLVAATLADPNVQSQVAEAYYFAWHDAMAGQGHPFGVVESTSSGDQFRPAMVAAFQNAGQGPAQSGAGPAPSGGGGGPSASTADLDLRTPLGAGVYVTECQSDASAQLVWKTAGGTSESTPASFAYPQSIAPGTDCGTQSHGLYPLVLDVASAGAFAGAWVVQCVDSSTQRVFRVDPSAPAGGKPAAAFLYAQAANGACP